MDESKVREIVEGNVEQMRWALQLQDWRLHFAYRDPGDGARATCLAESTPCLAHIEMDPAAFDNEEDVLRSLRHELLHVFFAEIELYRQAVGELVDDKVFDAIDILFKKATEDPVLRLERMFDLGLKISAKDLCKKPEND